MTICGLPELPCTGVDGSLVRGELLGRDRSKGRCRSGGSIGAGCGRGTRARVARRDVRRCHALVDGGTERGQVRGHRPRIAITGFTDTLPRPAGPRPPGNDERESATGV